eukprot:jgi/Tetstr1/440980/TSEL_029248.t1
MHTALKNLLASVAIEAEAVLDRDRSGVGDLILETSELRPADGPLAAVTFDAVGALATPTLEPDAGANASAPMWAVELRAAHTRVVDECGDAVLEDLAGPLASALHLLPSKRSHVARAGCSAAGAEPASAMRSAADLQAIPHYWDFPLHSMRKAAHGLSDICHDVKSALGVGVQILTDPSVLVSLPNGSDGRPADVGLFGYGGIRGNTVAVDTTIAPILGVSSSDPTTALRVAERHKIQKCDEGVRNAAGMLRFVPFAVSEFGSLAPHAEALFLGGARES